MSTEVTASVMIGPLAADSVHGTSEFGPGEKAFCPSHVLVLMEGARATWVMQRCPELDRPSPTWFIRTTSPEHLLAAALLGYVGLVSPAVIDASDSLRGAVTSAAAAKEVRIVLLTDALAAEVFERCAPHVFGMVTKVPGSTISDEELRTAAGNRFLVAVAGDGDGVGH